MEEIKLLPGMFGQFYLWYSDLNASRFSGANRWFLIVHPGGQFRTQGIDSLNTGVSGSVDDGLSATYRDIASYAWFDVYACNSQPTLPVAAPESNGAYSFIGRYANSLYGQTVANPIVTYEVVEVVNTDNVDISNLNIERYTSNSGNFQTEHNNIRWRIVGLPGYVAGIFQLISYSLYWYKNRPLLSGNTVPTGHEGVSTRTGAVAYVDIFNGANLLAGYTPFRPEQTAPYIPATYVSRYCAACEEFWGVLRPSLSGATAPFVVLIRFRVRCNVQPSPPVLSASEYEIGFSGGNTPVADISSVDPNEFDTIVFSKTGETKGGTTTNYFSIGTNNQLIATAGTPPGGYSLTIDANDGIASTASTVSFTVTMARIESFTAEAVSGDSVLCQFYLPEAISDEATIQWQRSAVDPDSPEFDESDWETKNEPMNVEREFRVESLELRVES